MDLYEIETLRTAIESIRVQELTMDESADYTDALNRIRAIGLPKEVENEAGETEIVQATDDEKKDSRLRSNFLYFQFFVRDAAGGLLVPPFAHSPPRPDDPTDGVDPIQGDLGKFHKANQRRVNRIIEACDNVLVPPKPKDGEQPPKKE